MNMWTCEVNLCVESVWSCQEGHLPHLQGAMSLQMKYSLFNEEKPWKKLFKDKKKLWWIHKATIEEEGHVSKYKPTWSWAHKHPTFHKKNINKHKSNEALKSNSGAEKGTLTWLFILLQLKFLKRIKNFRKSLLKLR